MNYERITLDGKTPFYKLGQLNLYNRKEIDKGVLLNEGYLCNAFMYMLCNRIGEVVANMPYYFENDNGERLDEVPEQALELFALMNAYDENAGMKVFIEKCIVNLQALGEFFIYKGKKAVGFSMPEYLDIISPADVTIQTKDGYSYSPVESYQVSYYNKSVIIPDEIVFGKYANISSRTKRGLSPFEPMWDIVKASTNSFRAHGVLIENMGANGILTPEAGENAMPSTPEERNMLQRAFDNFSTGFKNFMKVLATRGSYKWIPFNADPNKLKILEMQESSLRQLCAGLNMDSKLFNDSKASTYNNMSEAQKQAYLAAYAPTAQYFYDVMSRHFLDGIKWKVDKSKIEILNERDLNYEKKVSEDVDRRIIRVNEARTILYPELGDIEELNNNGDE